MSAQTATRPLVIGTRGSALARWQSQWVANALQRSWPDLSCELRPISTHGDRTQGAGQPLPEIGGTGLFTQELEDALRRGEIDLAVHSLKDLPIEDAPRVVVGAIPVREDARDVLVAREDRSLDQLPHGARVGTSSLRRAAQLLAARPDLNLLPLRGNVDTRIHKALNGVYDAIVLAAAGVLRLGLSRHITQYLPYELMLPAPGQGALAVQCRADDGQLLALLRPLDSAAARAPVTAERTFLRALGGGCAAPVAAFAQTGGDRAAVRLEGLIAAPDGRQVIRVAGEGKDPSHLGAELARAALVQGAGALLR